MNIVIVGCSRGIGKFLADNLKEHNLLRLSRTIEEGLYSRRVDVTDLRQIGYCSFYTKAIDWKKVDALIYCAGVQGRIGKAMDMSPEEWVNVMNTNLNGFWNTLWAFKDLLGKAETPRIMAIAGGGATKDRPNFSAYAASKTALVRLIETLAEENPTWRINAISPGAIRTKMTEEILQAGPHIAGLKECEDAHKAQAEPTEALELVKFLLSSSGDHITGRLIAAKWDDWRNPKCYTGSAGCLRRVEPEPVSKWKS